MKLFFGMTVLFFGLALNAFAGGSCGCKVKVVNVHEHEAMQCEENEVMVGHDMERGVVFCGTIQCDCGNCAPKPLPAH